MVDTNFQEIKEKIKPVVVNLIEIISQEHDEVPTEEIPVAGVGDLGPRINGYRTVRNPAKVVTSDYISEKGEEGYFEDVAEWLYETGHGFELSLTDGEGDPIENPSKEIVTNWYQRFLFDLTGAAMAYVGDFRFEEDAYEAAFKKEFVQQHYEDSPTLTTICYLYHFTGPEKAIDLDPEGVSPSDDSEIEKVEISPLTAEEVSAIYNFESFIFETGGSVGVETFSRASHKLKVKSCGNSVTPVETIMDHVVSALRLFGSNVPNIGRGRTFRFDYNWLTYREGIPRVSGSNRSAAPVNAFSDDYDLVDGQIDEFKSFWQRHSPSIKEEDSSLSTALRKFNQSYEKDSREDRLIDSAIAFESTIIKEIRQTESYRYRLPIRAAILLAHSELDEREFIYRFFREIYDARSSVVHTGSNLDSISVQDESYAPREFVQQTRKFLRQTLVSYLELLDEYPTIDEVNKEMDRAMREAPSPF